MKLSIAIGDGNAKIGRAKIVKTAHDMGIRTPLPDTPSLPIGADEVTVLDHTGAYATFPNLGKAVTPHAILEVRTGAGELVWRFDRDGPKPRQVLPPRRRRRHDQDDEQRGRRTAPASVRGSTASPPPARPAPPMLIAMPGSWVTRAISSAASGSAMTITRSTNRMTGGSLPAMTWHKIMAYAHDGVELKQLPGVAVPQVRQQPAVAEVKSKTQRAAARAAAGSAHQARVPISWSASSG